MSVKLYELHLCTKRQQKLQSNTGLLVLCGGFKAVKSFAVSCGYDDLFFYDL